MRLTSETISSEDLLRGFTLALGASGRREKTLSLYEDSVRALSEFARSLGLPGLAERAQTVVGEDIEPVVALTPDIGATVWFAVSSRVVLRRGVGGDVI